MNAARTASTCYQARLSGIWDIATDPRILDLVEDIAGPDFVCWASGGAFQSRRAIRGRSHGIRIASFWKLSPARTVTVWLAIDDVDAGNAAMRFIPGTHDKGGSSRLRRWAPTAVFHKGIADVERFGTPFTKYAGPPVRSRSMPDMLVHGSEGGKPLRNREGAAGLTPAATARPRSAIRRRGLGQGCRGESCAAQRPAGHWTHQPLAPGNDEHQGYEQARHVVRATNEGPGTCRSRGSATRPSSLTETSGPSRSSTDPYTPRRTSGYPGPIRESADLVHHFIGWDDDAHCRADRFPRRALRS